MNSTDDVAQINHLIMAFYAVFDNRGGRVPTAQSVVACLHPQSIIVKRSEAGIEVMNPALFAAPRIALLASGELLDFHEWETSGDTVIRGDIASRQSSYSKSGIWGGKPYQGSGEKMLQLVRENGIWKIVSVVWQDHGA